MMYNNKPHTQKKQNTYVSHRVRKRPTPTSPLQRGWRATCRSWRCSWIPGNDGEHFYLFGVPIRSYKYYIITDMCVYMYMYMYMYMYAYVNVYITINQICSE